MISRLRLNRKGPRPPSSGARKTPRRVPAPAVLEVLIATLVASTLLAGCNEDQAGYTAVSSISREGFARDAKAVRGMHGERVKLWGFVDHGNLFADPQAWTGPETRRPEENAGLWWRFNLKAGANDATGHSFAVFVPADEGRETLVRAFSDDAEARRPTRVYLTGKLFTFDAPLNTARRTGLYMELESSRDILLAPPRPEP